MIQCLVALSTTRDQIFNMIFNLITRVFNLIARDYLFLLGSTVRALLHA